MEVCLGKFCQHKCQVVLKDIASLKNVQCGLFWLLLLVILPVIRTDRNIHKAPMVFLLWTLYCWLVFTYSFTSQIKQYEKVPCSFQQASKYLENKVLYYVCHLLCLLSSSHSQLSHCLSYIYCTKVLNSLSRATNRKVKSNRDLLKSFIFSKV